MSAKERSITRQALVALGGDPKANFAVIDNTGELYLSLSLTSDFNIAEEEDYWEAQNYTLKKVVS